ncbi:FUSC family protein [Microbacterium sp. LRZ72]|uniref:FUSC family protein n=1 Tax=Microbacterium sp. LRZ72 TaxID=2942481 RepID=UPI0029BDB403|nr:FUSC family protein [Microbacterium sp. LRZ72]MDX2376709.1 FUSC family protein [Microbacterium sp. LRZ72]
MIDASRLLLAGKTAAAAALAWSLAPLLPLAEQQYSYYAPLGVLVSMYPTVASSARSGIQAMVGLALGIAIGLGGLFMVIGGLPAVIAVATVVGFGVLFGGIRLLGAGQSWVVFAALFVVLLGGEDAEDFSGSYLINMAFGVAIGFVVNLIAFPPLEIKRASARLAELRESVADELERIADAVETGPFDADELEAAMDELSDTVRAVADEVSAADDSSKGNPRARRAAQREQSADNAHRLRALERTTFFTRDLADALGRTGGDESVAGAVRPQLVTAIRSCAAVVDTPSGASDASEKLDAATRAVDEYLDAVDNQKTARASDVAADLTAAVSLRRMLDAARSFV